MQTENRFKNTEVSIEKKGTKIVLPNDPSEMTTQEAIDTLYRVQEAEETRITVHEEITAFPLEGAFAMMKAMKALYGWASAVPKPGFFGPTPPATISLEVGPGQTAQVIWGAFKLPNFHKDSMIETSARRSGGRPFFVIGGVVKKKEQAEVKRLADLTRQIVAQESIYRGKAIRITTSRDEGDADFSNPPTFLDTSRVDERELVFSDTLREQVQTNLFTPIEKTDMCRKLGIPLKRGILLEGPYGTGKTLTSLVTAKKCEENGWTFIMLDRVSGLKQALVFARLFAPAVVFAEDIDRSIEGSTRTVAIDDILNTIDGIDSKGGELITILTSNHVDRINRAMLRPGRLDAVLSIAPPDAKAAETLIRLYGRGLVRDSTDLTEVGSALAGQIPAVIREVVERAKLHAVSRVESVRGLFLACADLMHAITGMKAHLALMSPAPAHVPTAGEQMATAMSEIVAQAVKSTDAPTNIVDIQRRVKEVQARI